MEKVIINKLDNFGRGISFINEKVCFVEKALPNEVLEIEITKDKKNYSEGKIINYLSKSDYRINPKCPYYQKCGGCHIMHLEYKKQLKYKEEKLKELLEKFTGLKDIKINNIVSSKGKINYRNKITLHGLNNKIGLYQEKTTNLIKITSCLLVSDIINSIIERLNNYFEANETIEEIIIKNTSLNEIMIIIKGNINKYRFINNFSDINSIYLNNQLIYGKESITEKINNLYFEIYPNSFFQVNYNTMLEMYNKVIDYYKNNKNLRVLDLYCGTGTIGMLIAKYCSEVIGVEVNDDSIISANKCKEKNNINNINFYLGKVEDKIDMFNDIDSIIIDPPRSGLDKHTINTIIKLKPKSIVYISCDPVTLSRDLNILKDCYNIIEVTPIDMFPNTYHVESISVLERS